MYSIVKYGNSYVEVIKSSCIKRRKGYSVVRNYEVEVLYANKNLELCRYLVENIKSSIPFVKLEKCDVHLNKALKEDGNDEPMYRSSDSMELNDSISEATDALHDPTYEISNDEMIGNVSLEINTMQVLTHNEERELSDSISEATDELNDPTYEISDDYRAFSNDEMIENISLEVDTMQVLTHNKEIDNRTAEDSPKIIRNIEKNEAGPSMPYYEINDHIDRECGEKQEINLSVPTSVCRQSKKYCCPYCNTLFTKLVVHLENKHKTESDVAKFMKLPKGSSERKKIIDCIRKNGCFKFNTKASVNNGHLIVSRRPKKSTKTIHDYAVCPHCKGFFSKLTIRKHYPKCLPGFSGDDKSVHIMGKLISNRIHEVASPMLKKVLAVLRDDEVTRVIRYDELVMIFGNMLCEKYRLGHLHKMIRARLRLIGRFLLEVKKIDSTICSYSDVFFPNKFDACLESVKIVAGLNLDSGEFKSPATASEIGGLLKKCAKRLITMCIKSNDSEKKRNVEDFLQVLEQDFPIFINKSVMECQLTRKRLKNKTLPTSASITSFYNYVETKMKTFYLKLKQKFTYDTWKELAAYTLITIQVFNRKRAGELERVTITDFNNFQSYDNQENNAFISQNIHTLDKSGEEYVRIEIRGKKTRGVPILLSRGMFDSIQIILKYRIEANVPKDNPYVFGTAGCSTAPSHLSACNLMRKFSAESNLKDAKLLRGTHLRKHLATQSAYLNLGDDEVNDLANFMGHAEKIHREHYKIPVASREISRVSKLLELGIGARSSTAYCEVQKENNQRKSSLQNNEMTKSNEMGSDTSCVNEHHMTENNDITIDPSGKDLQRDSWNTSSGETMTEFGRERCVSPMGTVKRRTWSLGEVTRSTNVFSENIKNKNLPSLAECAIAIENNVELKDRSPAQLKAWVNNEIERKKRVFQGRTWSIDEKTIMMKVFQINLENEVLPGLKLCSQVREKYPILASRQPAAMKAWVNNAIRRTRKYKK